MPNPVQDLSQFRLPPEGRGRPRWIVQLWWIVQSVLFSPSPQFMFGWRRWLLRCFGAKIGHQVLIRSSAKILYPWNLTIGDWSWIGDDVVLYSAGQITLGSHVVISQRGYLCAGTHDLTRPDFQAVYLSIIVEDEAWLTTDVFVAPGVNIGRGAVVGARSSVFSDLPAMMVSHGTPAMPKRHRLEHT
ncbi:colanic acid biosynthesis acetyltransferase WcaF [Synechococcales cyanobacterium C]|uniref:Colanic acid biosynthesis acetyltransferase WcaF n=1 Tax=Petrachloros mirabilis ULC683 TaxID=2781853 RepID=A0A8K2A1E5_9CYAN|nr:WcaF family extracellular polysaccharide biosynthesis acetyltransferase [Petrachloros mirabilis]NCJ07657.1 colanic acid biosynthesis acetyltransferase WcaF [Petrachloros mirabilis ULC683]